MSEQFRSVTLSHKTLLPEFKRTAGERRQAFCSNLACCVERLSMQSVDEGRARVDIQVANE